MRAVMIDGFDAPVTVREIPTPDPKAGEVLLRVRAAGVNAADWRLWHGAYQGTQEHRFPITLGFDMAGVVERPGDGVDAYRGGEAVYGTLWKQVLLDGTFADYVVSPARWFFGVKPSTLDFVHAAAASMGGLTALVATDALRTKRDETLLIVGAAGSVGSFATQLASRQGVRVIATVRPGEGEYVTRMGAAETVDYTAEDVVEAVRARHPRGVDAVLDLVSRPDELSRIATLLHPGGRLVTTLFAADEAAYQARGIAATNVNTTHEPLLLERLRKAIDDGQLQVPIARTFALEEAAAALEYGEKGHPLGRIVLTVS
ncbi:NADP-dependent oxidoreductase [Anaeromyxobacter oryzae]|uniref:NADPH:quinone reductase n=1 Tax=Anaeromyxobacter oryzae TaxID=2918170 RepID=A0ABM7WZR6_9BACT|nr:NADP-dependent oxidoreductase [Anaeromyxobacter oryzae]BDG05039.1 NADPH:quinone reductase [Anaeromyxobacter oryzae]